MYDDDTTHDLEMHVESKRFDIYLSTQEVEIIDGWLGEFGSVFRFHDCDVEAYEGINTLDQIRNLLTKVHDTLSIRDDIDSRVAIDCSNDVIITRIIKCR